MRGNIGLVACCDAKASTPCQARDLYISPLFRAARDFAERSYTGWLILSAKHGVLQPTATVEPYDVALGQLAAAQRREWGERTAAQLVVILWDLRQWTFELHAGVHYRDALVPHLPYWSAPLAGLRIGQQLAWYRRHSCA